jgi:uncharacterized protein involved in exopolysaccharide biosynthesis
MSAMPGGEPHSFERYWAVLVRMRWVVVLTTLGSVAAAISVSLVLPRTYEARSQFYVVDSSDVGTAVIAGGAGSLGVSQGGETLPSTAEPVAAIHVGILQTDAIRNAVHRRVPQKSLAVWNGTSTSWRSRNTAERSGMDGDPQVAADLANAYPAALNEFLQGVTAQRAQESLRAMRQTQAELEAQLRAARKQQENFFRQEHTPSVKSELQALLARKGSLESHLQQAQARLEGIDQRIALSEQQLAREAVTALSPVGVQASTVIQQLLKEISDQEADVAGARSEFDGSQGEKQPRIRILLANLEAKKQALQKETATLEQSEVSRPVRCMSSCGARSEQPTSSARRPRPTSRRPDPRSPGSSPDRRATAAHVDGVGVAGRHRASGARAGQRFPLVAQQPDPGLRQERTRRHASAARAPSDPKLPSPTFNALVAGLLGLIAGVYLAFGYDWLVRARARRAA